MSMRMGVAIAIWAAGLSVAFAIVKVLRIGPVILVVSSEMGWGIHLGDFLAVIPLSLAAMATAALLRH